MVRTRVGSLLALAGVGLALSWLAEMLLVGAGGVIFVPPLALAITLVAVGVLAIIAALPIRRAVRSIERARVNPFVALRVVAFAKACALAAALILGAMLGIAFFVVSRPVAVAELLLHALVAAFGAVILLVGGLVAESFCVLPPDNKDPDAE